MCYHDSRSFNHSFFTHSQYYTQQISDTGVIFTPTIRTVKPNSCHKVTHEAILWTLSVGLDLHSSDSADLLDHAGEGTLNVSILTISDVWLIALLKPLG